MFTLLVTGCHTMACAFASSHTLIHCQSQRFALGNDGGLVIVEF